MDDVALYEPVYSEGQIATDGGLPWHVLASDHAEWREFRTLVEIYRSGAYRQHKLTGVMSPKFELKTGVPVEKFKAFAAASDAAVCFVNPGPQYVYCSLNAWTFGEATHPGLIECARALLDVAGVNLTISPSERHGPSVLCYSNFWVASEAFWEEYVGEVLNKLATFIEANPRKRSVRRASAETSHTTPTPFLPFITERLFTTFLAQREYFAERMPLDPEGLSLNQFEREIVVRMRSQVDRSDANGGVPSPELSDVLNLLSRLVVDYAKLYFATNKHPHASFRGDREYRRTRPSA